MWLLATNKPRGFERSTNLVYMYLYWYLNAHYPCPIPGDSEGIDLTLVYDHLAFAEYSMGNFRKALQYTKDLLQNGKTKR